MAGQETAPLGEDGLPLYEDGESILEEFLGAGVPSTRLRWHYRSTHESLITFSNISFYDAGLHTFPSVETDSHTRGLRFEHVADGVYEGKGVNPVEARRVVDEILRHARETPELTLGVGTFNLRQQLEIQDELERRRRQDPSLEPFFAPREEGSFFVKNLENIQGDERDVILLSVTYGRGPDGRIRHNFGPLNGENGWRRLNVLTTRAKRRMKVFSSMRGEDINVAQSTSRGARLLRGFLLYAEHGRLESAAPAAADEARRLAFERDVQTELARHGLRLQPQVGVAGYRIDFGVLDEAVPGRFLCGIECDGPAYGASETARDRDRLIQEVLAARGWTLLRVWSTDWFKDRAGQVERLLRQIEELRRRAREETEARRVDEAQEAGTASPPPKPALPTPAEEPSVTSSRLPRKRYERADEIPPEEYREAVLAVLRPGISLDRKALTNEVRALFGFNRTGPRLQEAIGAAIDGLLRDEVVGEGSAGIRLRG
jgi:very-short-patch-repair endonuclease